MSVWDTKEGQQALRDRAMDRAFMQDDWEPQPADDDRHTSAARPDDPKVPADYCEKCGYRWSTHDTTRADYKPPFGCPDEAQARAAWSGE